MILTDAIIIDRPVRAVWNVLVDFESWPQWAPTAVTITPIDMGPPRIGFRFLVKQPARPATVWTLTALEPGVLMAWQGKIRGARVTALHRLTLLGGNSTCHRTDMHIEGQFVRFAAPIIIPRTRRSLRLENQGLKSYCEGGAA